MNKADHDQVKAFLTMAHPFAVIVMGLPSLSDDAIDTVKHAFENDNRLQSMCLSDSTAFLCDSEETVEVVKELVNAVPQLHAYDFYP